MTDQEEIVEQANSKLHLDTAILGEILCVLVTNALIDNEPVNLTEIDRRITEMG